MRRNYLFIAILLIFVACGGGVDSQNDEVPELIDDSSFTHSSKTVTIYVHGYEKGGYQQKSVYGENASSDFRDRLVEFTGFPTLEDYNENNFSNIITDIEYYGDEAPYYYTQQDISDINSVTTQYGGGIPRYALIVAKFTKYILEETGAERVNIISTSMGSLITRWMIEKNLENLASNKKIEKWMSVEGLIRGSYALSKIDDIDNDYIKNIVESFFENSAETQQMKYSWIEENLTPNREIMGSRYYSDILVGQISLTDSEKDNIGLPYILPLNGGFQPNDGYQLVKDTYFDTIDYSIQAPSHTLIHTDHISIDDSNSAFATMSSFLQAKKRVRITLVDATVTDIHETISIINKKTEIVFESSIFSPKAEQKWDMENPIAQKVYDSGTLTLYNYDKDGDTEILDQIIFDDFVLTDETELKIKMQGYEIDRSTKYDLAEASISKKESIGEVIKTIELKNGTYTISADDWSGSLKVEIVEM